MPFTPDYTEKTWVSFEDLRKSTYLINRHHASDSRHDNIHVRSLRFEHCDLGLKWRYSSFTDCEFIACRFNGSNLQGVKFSDCSFRNCNFSYCTFEDCQFVSGCTFAGNSASAEQFTLKTTSIPASAFLQELVTNIKYIPDTEATTPEFQLNKHFKTKLGIAQRIYGATREENDIELFAQAYRELILCTIDWNIERHRYYPKSKHEMPKLRNHFLFLWLSFPAHFEKPIIRFSGYLSDWGRSVARPLSVFLFLLTAFYYWYMFTIPHASLWDLVSARDIFLRSLDVTLVAGYTAHCEPTDNVPTRWLTAVNMIAGLYWYSLMVPVLTRRLLR